MPVVAREPFVVGTAVGVALTVLAATLDTIERTAWQPGGVE